MLCREFDASLKRLLEVCRLSCKVFKDHSIRTGAATSTALRGEGGVTPVVCRNAIRILRALFFIVGIRARFMLSALAWNY